MTAPDPRLDEIQARLDAATPGPWEWDGTDVSQCDNGWSIVMENTVSCGSYCYGGSVSQEIRQKDREFIANAPADVAFLLAELRKAHEALAEAWEQGRDAEFQRSVMKRQADPNPYRAAVAAAKGDERG